MSDESFMHAAGESHDCVVPAKAPNEDRQGLAEGLEGRAVDQGEHHRGQPEPDAESGDRASPGPPRCAGSSEKG